LGPNDVPYTWTFDLSVFFKSPVDDWSDLLPYHRWNLPAGAWLSADSLSTWTYPNWGYEHWEYVRHGVNSCSYDYWPQVGQITYRSQEWHLDADSFIEFLDGPNGKPIDLDVARVPYFPDYTFNRLFPDMDRADWIELIDILDQESHTTLVWRPALGAAR
jgi:hypothetical protein